MTNTKTVSNNFSKTFLPGQTQNDIARFERDETKVQKPNLRKCVVTKRKEQHMQSTDRDNIDAELERYHNEFLKIMERITPRDPRWRYFKHGDYLYGWTTERMGDGKFAAMIYHVTKISDDHEQLKLCREVHFTKRKTAKAKAWAWVTKARGNASGRLSAKELSG